jgi:hypothetical protein
VNVAATTGSLTINGGTVSYDITLCHAGENLNSLQGAVSVNGAGVLTVNDQANTTNTAYTMTAGSLTRAGFAGIFYSNNQGGSGDVFFNGASGTNTTYTIFGTLPTNTILQLGNGRNNVINVEATSPIGSLNVFEANSGATVNVSPAAQNLDNIQGAVFFNSHQGGLDFLTINDQNNAAAQTYTMTAGVSGTSITRTGSAAIDFDHLLNVLTLNGGSGADTYLFMGGGLNGTTLNDGAGNNTVNVLSGTVLSVNTGVNDTINVTSSTNTLDPIGRVTVNDPTGTTAITVDDSGFGGNEDYAITSTTVMIGRSGVFSLTYIGIAALDLSAGPGSDIFDIDSSSAVTTINAGGGANSFHIGGTLGGIGTQYLASSILGPLFLNGGGGDVLDFFDANDPASETFNFDAVPSTLTLGSTGTTIATFSGMGGGIFVMTNGVSTANDLSGTVIFDPAGGPPSGPGRGSRPPIQFWIVHIAVNPVSDVPKPDPLPRNVPSAAASVPARSVIKSLDQLAIVDEVFAVFS